MFTQKVCEYKIAPGKLKTVDLGMTFSMRISTAFKGYRAVASSFGAETPRFPTSSVPCLFVSPTFLLSFPLPLATRWPTEID